MLCSIYSNIANCSIPLTNGKRSRSKSKSKSDSFKTEEYSLLNVGFEFGAISFSTLVFVSFDF